MYSGAKPNYKCIKNSIIVAQNFHTKRHRFSTGKNFQRFKLKLIDNRNLRIASTPKSEISIKSSTGK